MRQYTLPQFLLIPNPVMTTPWESQERRQCSFLSWCFSSLHGYLLIENLRHFRTEPLFLSSYLSLERKPQVWHLLNNHMVKFAVSVKAAVKNYTHWFCFRTIRWAPKATKLYDVEYTNIFHNNTHSRVLKIDLILRIYTRIEDS